MPYEMPPLRVSNTDDLFLVTYLLPTMRIAFLFQLLPFLGLCTAMYYWGPILGYWIVNIMIIALAVFGALLYLIIVQRFIIAPFKPKQVRLVCRKRDKILEFPVDAAEIPFSSVQAIYTLHGWYRHEWKSALVSEVSVVYEEKDGLMRSALFLTNKWRANKIATTLSKLTGTEHVTIKKR